MEAELDSVTSPLAWCDGLLGAELVEYSQNLADLNTAGRWVVVIEFDGKPHLFRFRRWLPGAVAQVAGPWRGPTVSSYATTLDSAAYQHGVTAIRDDIARGWLYQANLCRVLSARLPDPARVDIMGLATLLQARNRAPYALALRVPEVGVQIACASPELFLARSGSVIESGPIKGTAQTPSGLTDKDRAENVMIADLVRNDLGRICRPGSVHVPRLLSTEQHPGLVHLVSRVAGQLATDDWPEILAATFPPGSVSGAPKFSALQTINSLEPQARGPYCGAIGWVDADRGEARLAVGIRTFWQTLDGNRSPVINFGTGAGITWGSDPAAEWSETELKAQHLIQVAAGEYK